LPLPRKIGIVIDRCLLKEPDARPATASIVGDMLSAAMEQRRELPAALRAFVKRNARLNGGGTLVGALLLLPVSVFFSYWFGSTAGFGAAIVGGFVAPFTYFIDAARGLLKQGFSHADLAMAFKAEIEQNEEELRIDRRPPRPVIAAITKYASLLCGVTGAFVFLGMLQAPQRELGLYGFWLGMSVGFSMIFGIANLSLAQQQHDVDTKFWSEVWLGSIGKSAFRIAKRFFGRTVSASAMTHRATELSLGLAAEQLFDSLPKATRKSLAAVPEILNRLQMDAQALRKQHDELQDVIAVSGKADAHLVALRDSTHDKLGKAVSALETIRLDLLRLHAGSTTVQSVTTHLGIAAEVSDEIARLVAASSEVEAMMKYPRLAASTPV
jgi:eukaryotic-like serine/threonine-protein kinase